jgi:hypothetical protein
MRTIVSSALLGMLASFLLHAQELQVGHAHGPMQVLESHEDGSQVSPNWSGYAVVDPYDEVHGVTGSWIVPDAVCGAPYPRNSGASYWVGIDGYNTATVEQTGTDTDCDGGVPVYYAWYEFFPKPGVTIKSITVHPGDLMTASVTYLNDEFTVTITDETSSETFTTSQSVPHARRNSAEWIVEANSNNFTNFGTAFFGLDNTGVADTCAATLGDRFEPIGKFKVDRVHAIYMADSNGKVMAIPSALTKDGSSFSVEWQSAR